MIAVTDVFLHDFYNVSEAGSTIVKEKDVGLLKLEKSVDIDTYQTLALPQQNVDYRGKPTSYFGEL